MRYKVTITERVSYSVLIEAETPEQATDKAKVGNWIAIGAIDTSYLEISEPKPPSEDDQTGWIYPNPKDKE